jgi:hypothetical protein
VNAIDIIDRRLAVLRRQVMREGALQALVSAIPTRIHELERLRSELIDNEPQEAA